MRKAINKDFFREIKNTWNRYLSILFIVALGVAFFSGIRATSPDMKLTLDHYLDATHYMDIRVLSTLGLTDEDLAVMGDIDGVSAVEASYYYDAYDIHQDERRTLRFISEPEQINQMTLVSGRMIASPDECVVDTFLIDKYGYAVGDTIKVVAPESDETVADQLSVNQFTIVGTATSSAYFTISRDTTTIGSGETEAFVYLSRDVFKAEAYSAAYILVAGAESEVAYSDAYDAVVAAVTDQLDAIKTKREHVRYESVMAEANDALGEAESEAESKLNDAAQKIADGEADLADGRKKLQENRDAYDKQIASAEEQIAAAEKKINDGAATIKANEKKLKNGESALDDAKEELAASRKKLDSNWDAYEDGLAQANAGQAALDAGREQLLTSQAEAQAQKETLDGQQTEAESQLAALEVAIAAAREQFQTAEESEKAVIEETIATYEQQQMALHEGLATILAGQQTIADGLAEIEAQLAGLDESQAELDSTLEILTASKEALASGEAEYASGAAVIEKKQKELADGKTALKDAKSELAEGKEQLKDSKATLKDQMAEAEEKFSEAESKLAVGEAELVTAREDYAEGKKEADEKIAEAKADIAAIDYPEWYVLDRSASQAYVEYEQNAARINAIGHVFPVIFFLVAALMSLTTMTRMVESQRTQIGTLKALGYPTWPVARKYVYYALSASVIGSTIGLIFGQKFLPWIIITTYKILYPNLPIVLTPINVYYSIIASVAAIICVTGAAFAACYRSLAASPAALMRPEAPVMGRKIWLEYISFLWRRLKFTSKVTMRNLFRYKKRFFMTVLGIGGCTALVIFGFGLTDSISGVVDRQYQTLFHYDLTIAIDEKADADAIAAFNRYMTDDLLAENYVYVRSKSLSIQGKDTSYTAYLEVPSDPKEYKKFVTMQDRQTGNTYTLTDDAVIITEKLAELMGLSVDDTFKIEDEDMTREVKVGAITENYILSYVYMTPVYYETVFGKAPVCNAVRAIVQNLNVDNEAVISEKLMKLDAVNGTTTTSYTRQKFDEALGSLDVITLVVIIAAGLLAFIVLYNLNNMNISERRRELATIKVLGFYDREVAAYVYRENMLLTLIGTLVGLVFGKFLHAYIIITVETDILMFIRHAALSSYGWSVVITFAFSLIVNGLMYGHLKKIDMVESLKSVE